MAATRTTVLTGTPNPPTIFKLLNLIPRVKFKTAKVFDLNTVATLVKKARCEVENDPHDKDENAFKVIRYLVTTDYQPRFGFEGPASKIIATHSQLSDNDKCLAAGNLYFNDQDEIACMNNQSGDFHPDFQAIIIAARLLIQNGFRFAANIELMEVRPDGAKVFHPMTYAELIAEIQALDPQFTVPTDMPNPLAVQPQTTPARESFLLSTARMTNLLNTTRRLHMPDPEDSNPSTPAQEAALAMATMRRESRALLENTLENYPEEQQSIQVRDIAFTPSNIALPTPDLAGFPSHMTAERQRRR